jgi:uncharacterized cupin superfamily protein
MDNGSAYGLVQLRELPDTAVTGGFSQTMEARFADEALGCQQGGVSLQRVKPSTRLAFAHRHTRDEEVYVVVAGSGRAVVDGHVVDLRPWSALRIAPGRGHSFEAGASGLELLVFRPHTDGDESELTDAAWPD